MATRKRVDDGGPQTSKRPKAADIFDARILDCLRNRSDPFLFGLTPTTADNKIVAAVELLSANQHLTQFGVDGDGCNLGAIAAHALGSLAVATLVFPLALEFSAAGREAFTKALGANPLIKTLKLAATNLDGEMDDSWSPASSPFVAEVQRLRSQCGLESIRIEGDAGFDVEQAESEEQESGDDITEDGDFVQCDRRSCGRELYERSETVYTSALGQDYCEDCVARFTEQRRSTLRKTSVGARLGESLC